MPRPAQSNDISFTTLRHRRRDRKKFELLRRAASAQPTRWIKDVCRSPEKPRMRAPSAVFTLIDRMFFEQCSMHTTQARVGNDSRRILMLDRRQIVRDRVYYGAVIAFNQRNATMECLVRDFSSRGAKLEFESAALLPDDIDLSIPRKGTSWTARVIWRRANAAGFAFRDPKQTAALVPLDWAIRLRASERARKELRRRLEQLLSEH
jgi:PilZ domain